ncbi:unnamed protein product [Parascedosporium putredinis]|uniref:DUF3176 domain containing protein n=1 Tax=Parascedosporium putredinis TaxID=1442378 RepID=A0A9P1H616_9PEZI|nr:unnamed protein product [Parascedosporium putredinis]CAI7997035.1 unnamed protein product [Parascedosporium putredinis]
MVSAVSIPQMGYQRPAHSPQIEEDYEYKTNNSSSYGGVYVFENDQHEVSSVGMLGLEDAPNGKGTASQASRRRKRWYTRWNWSLEAANFAVSLAAFIGIIVLLWRYDQQTPPEWPLQLTLNTLVALMTTISTAGMMLPLYEAIGQWKWNMYWNKTRPLHDFHVLDLASRGFWGSCSLVARFHVKHPVSVAGALCILSALTYPITQQVLDYPSRQVGDAVDRLGITRAQTWDEANAAGITKAITDGTSSFVDHVPAHMLATCPTSKCTFPVHLVTPLSYAFLAHGADRTLAFEGDAINYAVLADFFIITSAAGNVSYPGYDRTREDAWRFRAYELLLYLCVNEYETAMEQGISVTNVTSSSTTPAGPGSENTGICEPRSDSEGEDDFEFGTPSFLGTSTNLNVIMYSQLIWNGLQSDSAIATAGSSFYLRAALWGQDDALDDAETQFERLNSLYDGLATSMSNHIRSSDALPIAGTAWKDETFVQVRWPWLTFLAAMIAMSFFFFLFTVITTHRLQVPVLKGSAIGSMLAPNPEVQSALGSLLDLDDAQQRAKFVRVRFEGEKFHLDDGNNQP